MLHKKYIYAAITCLVACILPTYLYFHSYTPSSPLPTQHIETCIDTVCLTPDTPHHAYNQKVVIINVNGVVFKEDLMRIVKKVGFGRLTSFALSNMKSPVDACLDILHKMALEQQTDATRKIVYQGRNLPGCIVDWQLGNCSYVEVKQKLKNYIDALDAQQYFSNTNERDVTTDILNIAFDPAQFSDAAKPVTNMVALLQELKKRGYMLYVLTNMPHEMRAAITQAFPDVMSLFNGVIISADANALKTEEKLFTYFLTSHAIEPHNCTFIDDEAEAIAIAQKIGMNAITFSDIKTLKKDLHNLNLL